MYHVFCYQHDIVTSSRHQIHAAFDFLFLNGEMSIVYFMLYGAITDKSNLKKERFTLVVSLRALSVKAASAFCEVKGCMLIVSIDIISV